MSDMEVLIKRRRGLTYIYVTKSVMITCYKLKHGNDLLREYTSCSPSQLRQLDPTGEITVSLTGNLAEFFDKVHLQAELAKANKKVTTMEERKGCLR